MRPIFRRVAIAVIIAASMAPGLVQASSFHGSSQIVATESGHDVSFLNAVWSLLTEMFTGRFPARLAAVPLTAKDTTDPGDNGGRLDPNGTPAMVAPRTNSNG